MARPSKPTNVISFEKRSHRTKAEMQYREQGERAMQTGQPICESVQVKADEIAHEEFLRLRDLYAEIEYVDALDQQIINRYCLEVANTYLLQETLKRLEDELKTVEETADRLQVYSLITKANAEMNKNKELLLKYEDRLLLNPAARIRAVPKTPPKEEKTSGMAAYLAKRADG